VAVVYTAVKFIFSYKKLSLLDRRINIIFQECVYCMYLKWARKNQRYQINAVTWFDWQQAVRKIIFIIHRCHCPKHSETSPFISKISLKITNVLFSEQHFQKQLQFIAERYFVFNTVRVLAWSGFV